MVDIVGEYHAEREHVLFQGWTMFIITFCYSTCTGFMDVFGEGEHCLFQLEEEKKISNTKAVIGGKCFKIAVM